MEPDGQYVTLFIIAPTLDHILNLINPAHTFNTISQRSILISLPHLCPGYFQLSYKA
jgi:hypothetical protein